MSQDIHNETSVFITKGVTIITPGNITSLGFIQNNGNIHLSGNWLNTNIYQGTGSISLEGVNQTFSNNDQPLSYLIAEGGGVKTIKGNLLITQQVDFNNGLLLVRGNDALTMENNCEINNASLLSYVDGPLISKGTGYKFYPVGKNGAFHPVELTEVKGIDPVVQVEVIEDLPAVQTSAAANLYKKFYWTRNTNAGSFESSPITLALEVSNFVDPLRLVIAESNSINETFNLIDNVTYRPSATLDIIGSRKAVTGNVFVLGEIPVDPPRQQYLSTTLSPNAENSVNRVIKIFGDNPNPSIFSFQVFNRWGSLIFESTSYSMMSTDGWDGRQQGTLLQSGVYPYNLKMVDMHGNTISRTGFVTVIN